MNKRGQFYLIAALVIVGVIIAMLAIYNYAKVFERETTVYDLTSEIDYEASQVIDSGIFQSLNASELSSQLENLTDYYAKTNQGSDLVILYGNETTLTIILYNNSETGSVGISLGGSQITFLQTSGTKYKNTTSYSAAQGPQQTVTVVIPPGAEYEFVLIRGQIFYIVLKKESEGESFVSRSD